MGLRNGPSPTILGHKTRLPLGDGGGGTLSYKTGPNLVPQARHSWLLYSPNLDHYNHYFLSDCVQEDGVATVCPGSNAQGNIPSGKFIGKCYALHLTIDLSKH